jgi:uncharacterized RDD family membrane protein YckC
VALAWQGISSRQWPLPELGLGAKIAHNPLQKLDFWRGKLVHFIGVTVDESGKVESRIGLIDPETGDVEQLEARLTGKQWCEPIVFDDRIMFVGRSESFELVDGVLQNSDMKQTDFCFLTRQRFLLDGIPAVIQSTRNGNEVKLFQGGRWRSHGVVPDNPCTVGGQNVAVEGQAFQVFNTPQGQHVFAIFKDRLFYHRGLEIASLPTPKDIPMRPLLEAANRGDLPVSALDAVNLDAVTSDWWSLVREEPASLLHGYVATIGLMVAGQPAALIVDDVATGNAIGRLYRFDGTTWNEYASQPFPFGSATFATVTTDDGQRSYVGVRTTYGDSYFYALETRGFRLTPGSADLKTRGGELTNQAYAIPFFYGALFSVTLLLGLFLGLCIWPMMFLYTQPGYVFGVQSALLASLGWRGLARLIDLGLIGATTAGLGWLMMRGYNWLEFAEALNLGVYHPTIPVASRIATVLAVWLTINILAMLTTQGVWGVTPGKWLCRLKTVRTSLRPCGFARSLAREIVFFVDCCNFVCWTPGILSIALSDRRQRLGDFVADTIVVDANSLNATRQTEVIPGE